MSNVVNTNIMTAWSSALSGNGYAIKYFFKKEHAIKYQKGAEYGEVKEVKVIKSDGYYYLLVSPTEIPIDTGAEYQRFLYQESALSKLTAAEKQALGL